MLKGLAKMIGGSDDKVIRRLQPDVDEINTLEPEAEALSADELRAKTAEIADICHNFLPKPFEIVDLENALEEQVSQAS